MIKSVGAWQLANSLSSLLLEHIISHSSLRYALCLQISVIPNVVYWSLILDGICSERL